MTLTLPLSEPVLMPSRQAELLAALRAQCPPSRSAELEQYLNNYPPTAARARYRDWAGLASDGKVFVDPNHPRLDIYLHEVAHVMRGPAERGHDAVFQQIAETLYSRFQCTRSAAGVQYDVHEDHGENRTRGAISSRQWHAKRLAENTEPSDLPGRLVELGDEARVREDAQARLDEWLGVLGPLVVVALPAVLLCAWFYFGVGDWWNSLPRLVHAGAFFLALVGLVLWALRD